MARITKRLVESAKPEPKDTFIWDDELKGFGVRIKSSGKRSYLIQYRNGFGRSRRLTLGTHGRLTAEEARREARLRLRDVDLGKDPAEERRAMRNAPILQEFLDQYLADYALDRKKPSTLGSDKTNLRRHILPALGRLPVTAITHNDVVQLHQSMRQTPGAANRTIEFLSGMMTVAERWGFRENGSNPCRGVEKYKGKKRERFLSAAELSRLGDALAEVERTQTISVYAAAAIRLLLFTACRRGEILGLMWDGVDLETGRLHLADTKTGPRVVTLNAPAKAVLSQLRQKDGSPYVFPGTGGSGHIVDLNRPWRKLRSMARLKDMRLHDLRHTFASISVSSGESLYLTGKLLGHAKARTTERYAHFADDPIKAATERVGNAIDAMLRGEEAEVIPLKRGGSV